jgi:hypothetical protein
MLDFIKKLFGKDEKMPIYDETDSRNFNSSNIAGQISKEDLVDLDFVNFMPAEFIDQVSTDFCVGCGEAYAKEATEGKPMSWNGAFALCCKLLGYIESWGTSILRMKKAGQKYGVPCRELWPYRQDKSRDWNADWKNMPQNVLDDALFHKDDSYWEVDIPWGWDDFDAFRATLWKFRTKKIVIQCAVDKHNVTLVGQKMIEGIMYLVGIDSYGTRSQNYRVGKSINGIRYFTRSEANLLSTGYFSIDIGRTLAELLNKYNEKAVKTDDSPDCFLIKNGQRHNLVNEYVAMSNNCLLFEPLNVYTISKDEMNLIPEGETAKFREGANWQIVQRLLEKFDKKEIINTLK